MIIAQQSAHAEHYGCNQESQRGRTCAVNEHIQQKSVLQESLPLPIHPLSEARENSMHSSHPCLHTRQQMKLQQFALWE